MPATIARLNPSTPQEMMRVTQSSGKVVDVSVGHIIKFIKANKLIIYAKVTAFSAQDQPSAITYSEGPYRPDAQLTETELDTLENLMVKSA